MLFFRGGLRPRDLRSFFVCAFLLLTISASCLRSVLASPAIIAGGSASLDSGPGGNGSSSPGVPKPWLGGTEGLNLASGNKLTTIPLVGWTGRGGLSVGVALFHNSQSVSNEIAVNWTMSYESRVTFDGSGNATITWEDGGATTFTRAGSVYTAPTGEHGSFSQTSTSPVLYEYVSPGQTHYVFTGSLSGFLTKIYDLNGNAVTISRSSTTPLQISTVTDPTGRAITYTWTGSQLTQISDPLSRIWSFGYSSPSNIGCVYESGEGAEPGEYVADHTGVLLLSVSLSPPVVKCPYRRSKSAHL